MIPILYKGSQSLASCSAQDDFILYCSPNEKTQTKKDIIQISNAQPEGSTIKWNNLDEAVQDMEGFLKKVYPNKL